MEYYELTCKTYLKEDIYFQDSFNALSKYINFSICQLPDYKVLHEQRGFKHYCFSSFYPPQKNGIYKKDETYSFTLRGIDKEFMQKLSFALRQNINNPHLQVITIHQKTIQQFFIHELYSITPVITTIDEGDGVPKNWSVHQNGDVMQLAKQLHENLLKKYESFYSTKLEATQNFIQLLVIKNQKPMSIAFTKKIGTQTKKIRLFGNKFHMHVNEDEVSQKLAFMALGCSLGEKSSLGAGFVKWR